MRRGIILCAAAAAVLGVAVAPASAQSSCTASCQDEFDAAVDECDAALQADLDELAADEADCANKQNVDACLEAVGKRRRNAIRQNENCVRVADNQFDNCISKCDESPAER